MLDKFVGQAINLITYSDYMSLAVVGTLATVVGENNYILRVKDTDVTIRFRVAELDSIREPSHRTENNGLLTVYINPTYLSIRDVIT